MKLIAFLAFILPLLSSVAHAEITLRLGNSRYPPIVTTSHDGVIDQIYKELSRRLGIKIIIDQVETGERVLINANSGIDDGDVGRGIGLEKRYPNLVIVPVPVYHYQMAVFARDIDFHVAGFDSIKPYDIGILRGWKILEDITQGARSVTSVESGEQLFTMLDKGRIEIAVFEKSQALAILNKMKIPGIKLLQPSLLEGDFYLYLHKKHQKLIPAITKELKNMQKDGTIKRINEAALKQYVYR
jgi:polar amino acid transport system substrate-binding protein